jgi:hypothetical protein
VQENKPSSGRNIEQVKQAFIEAAMREEAAAMNYTPDELAAIKAAELKRLRRQKPRRAGYTTNKGKGTDKQTRKQTKISRRKNR